MVKNTHPKHPIWDGIKSIAAYITAILTIAGIGFGIGCWKSQMEHRQEISEINQQHNIELVDLKMEYNQKTLELQAISDRQIIELKNELNIVRLPSNKTSNGK